MDNNPGSGVAGNDKANGNGADSQFLATATNVGATAGKAVATAAGLGQTAQQYGQKISDAAGQAKDFVSDQVSGLGDKIKDLKDVDLNEFADSAKDYARRNPTQAILISAAAGLLLGLLIRGRR